VSQTIWLTLKALDDQAEQLATCALFTFSVARYFPWLHIIGWAVHCRKMKDPKWRGINSITGILGLLAWAVAPTNWDRSPFDIYVLCDYSWVGRNVLGKAFVFIMAGWKGLVTAAWFLPLHGWMG
jgi:hypothetical protein